MANHNIKDPPEFNPDLRMLETTDPAHADMFNALFDILINNDIYLLNRSAARILRMDIVIPANGWDADTDTNGAYALRFDVSGDGITEDMIPFLILYPESQEIAKGCDLCTTSRSVDGALRVYANQVPEAEMKGSLFLICETGGTGSTGTGAYELPIATESQLGGVKIGENISIETDGTISIKDESIIEEISAPEADVEEMLDEVFGKTETTETEDGNN